MNYLEFIIDLLTLISFDIFIGFITFVAYNFFDKKYNSKLEINILKEENKFLKDENKKVNGSSTSFWSDSDD